MFLTCGCARNAGLEGWCWSQCWSQQQAAEPWGFFWTQDWSSSHESNGLAAAGMKWWIILSLFPPAPLQEVSAGRSSMEWGWGWNSHLAAGMLFPATGKDIWSVLHRFPGYIWDASPWIAIPTGSQKAVRPHGKSWNGTGDDYQWIFKTLGGTASDWD